jgi:hypothetical protein
MIHGYWLEKYGISGSYGLLPVPPDEAPHFLQIFPFLEQMLPFPIKKLPFIALTKQTNRRAGLEL